MSAHHAPRGVWKPVRATGNVLATIGVLLVGGLFVSAVGVSGASTGSGTSALLWGKSEGPFLIGAWGAPFGEGAAGVLLIVFAVIAMKVSPFLNRRREGIATFAFSPSRKRGIVDRLAQLMGERAYPQRRIGRRATVCGMLALLVSGGTVALFLDVRDTLVADGAELQFGAQAAMVLAAAAVATSLVLVGLGIRAWTTAPSAEETRAAAVAPVAPIGPAPPPMPPIPVPQMPVAPPPPPARP